MAHSRWLHFAEPTVASLIRSEVESTMPYTPTNPQPPFAEPGKNRPEDEIRQPGSYKPERDADPEPPVNDDPIEPLER